MSMSVGTFPRLKMVSPGEESPESEHTIHGDVTSSVATSTPVSRNFSGIGLCHEGIPKKIHRVEYAVRGAVYARAFEVAADMGGRPYSMVLPCHIGNPMALGMRPMTHIRETVALVASPHLLESKVNALSKIYDPANIARAQRYMKILKSPGAYTESLGARGLRQEIAEFLGRRDGVEPNVDSIMMSNGASEGITSLLSCLVGGLADGIIVPMPQYPLYTAVITKFGGSVIFYELDEEKQWSLDVKNLQESFDKALSEGITPKAIVVICPGNPAPTFLSRDQVVHILKFAAERNVLVIADEVYQENIYHPQTHPFHPFRKVLLEEKLLTQLASVHSSSKGLTGECGFRGGFVQLENVSADAMAVLAKMRSVELCPNTMGQVVMACVINPPRPGDSNYEIYLAERNSSLQDFAKKAELTHTFFNSLSRTTCQPILGALYAFPNIEFPQAFLEEAKGQNKSPELLYCLELLEATGIVTVNGDGFGQKVGTHHLRMAILPKMHDLEDGLARWRVFHEDLMRKFEK